MKIICIVSGVKNDILEEPFDTVSRSVEATYDALKEQRDYLSYRPICATSADLFESLTEVEKVSNRIRPTARKHLRSLFMKVMEAKTRKIANKKPEGSPSSNSGPRIGNKGGKKASEASPTSANQRDNKASKYTSPLTGRYLKIIKGSDDATGEAKKTAAGDR